MRCLLIVMLWVNLFAVGYTEETAKAFSHSVRIIQTRKIDTGKDIVIRTYRSVGVVVDRKGYVLTCAHGLNPFNYLNRYILTFNSIRLNFDIVYYNSKDDIALLRVLDPPNLNEVKLSRGVTVGEKVISVGSSPDVGDFFIRRGYFSGVDPNGSSVLDMRVIPGMSGSGVFNSSGELIGIVVMTYQNKVGIAVPLSTLHIIYRNRANYFIEIGLRNKTEVIIERY